MPDRLSRPAVRRVEQAHTQLQIAHKQLAPTDPEMADRLDDITVHIEALTRMLEASEDESGRWRTDQPTDHQR